MIVYCNSQHGLGGIIAGFCYFTRAPARLGPHLGPFLLPAACWERRGARRGGSRPGGGRAFDGGEGGDGDAGGGIGSQGRVAGVQCGSRREYIIYLSIRMFDFLENLGYIRIE